MVCHLSEGRSFAKRWVFRHKVLKVGHLSKGGLLQPCWWMPGEKSACLSFSHLLSLSFAFYCNCCLILILLLFFVCLVFLQDISLSLPLPLSSCFVTLLSLWWFIWLWPGGSQMIVKSWLARVESYMLMMPQWPFSLFSPSLVKGRESDGFPEMQDRLVRQALKEFPYPESQLLQQLVRQIAPIKIVSAEAPTKHYHRNRKKPGAFLVDLIDSGGSQHLIIICNIYIAPNPTTLAENTSQFKSRMVITIKTWNMHIPDNPMLTAKHRQTCTHPGTTSAT